GLDLHFDTVIALLDGADLRRELDSGSWAKLPGAQARCWRAYAARTARHADSASRPLAGRNRTPRLISRLARSQTRNLGSINPCRVTSPTIPSSSSISSVAACVVAVRGPSSTRASLSKSLTSSPCCACASAVTKPTGPPPAMIRDARIALLDLLSVVVSL